MKIKQHETIPERKLDGICKKCKEIVSIKVDEIHFETDDEGKLDGTYVGHGLVILHFTCPKCRKKSRLLPKT